MQYGQIDFDNIYHGIYTPACLIIAFQMMIHCNRIYIWSVSAFGPTTALTQMGKEKIMYSTHHDRKNVFMATACYFAYKACSIRT